MIIRIFKADIIKSVAESRSKTIGDSDIENVQNIITAVAEAYPDAVVTIYDRFGKKLIEIKGNESWDGMYLGRKMPSTDYWYEIWIDEIRKKYVGHFTLIND